MRNKVDDPFFDGCIIFDINQDLEYVLKLINPDIVFHLASLTNSEECSMNKIQTLEINGTLICKIIEQTRSDCKVINASSCEIYKGNGTYEIQEDDMNYNPTHPYAFAKYFSYKKMSKSYKRMEIRI